MNSIEDINSGLLPASGFLERYSVAACMKMYGNVCTIEQSLKTQSPSLVSIKTGYSKEFMLAYISGWIINLNEFLNVLRKMTEMQIEETAWLIAQEYYFYTITDLYVLFSKAKKGDYGQFYDCIDGTKILGWFSTYDMERCNTAFNLSEQDSWKYRFPEQERLSPAIRQQFKNDQVRYLQEQFEKTANKFNINNDLS